MRRATGYIALRVIILLAFGTLVGRLWYMQVVRVNAYRAQGVAREAQYRPVLAPRGIIYDRNGRPLVRNLPSLDVTVTPGRWSALRSRPESRLLSRLLHGSPSARAIRRVVARNSSFPTRPVALKTDLGLKTFYVVGSYENQLPGVEATVDLTRRQYLERGPYPLSHILGYTGVIDSTELRLDTNPRGTYKSQHYTNLDTVGKTGIESVFEHTLHGSNGLQRSLIDVNGNQVTRWRTVRRAKAGLGVRLTIDSRLERLAALDLKAAMNKLSVRSGAAVALDPNNGHVLAMVSLPSYNNNLFTRVGSRSSKRLAQVLTSKQHPLVDLATQAQLPPGSIFKIITATAGLEDGVISPSTEVDDTGTLLRCPTCQPFHGWNPAGLGWVNVVSAIEQSSDIFFYQVAGGGPGIPGNGLGAGRLGTWARRYGLGRPTGVDLPSEASGVVPTKKLAQRLEGRPWSWGDSYNTGIGQGYTLVTPIQMAAAVSVIANGGNLIRPQIVDGVTTANGKRTLPGKNFGLVPDIVRRHYVAPWVIQLIRQGMRLGVTSTNGTSHFNVDLRNQSAGKTGTAQAGNKVDAWWIGFAPYDHPKIAIAVVIPDAGAEGAFSAAPIGSKIIDDYLHIKDPTWLNQVEKRLDFTN